VLYPEHITLFALFYMLKLCNTPQFPAVFVVAKLVYALSAITFSAPSAKMIEETAAGEDDRASFLVSFVTPSTQSQSTSPIHDSHGAQISSDCAGKYISLVPHFLLTHSDFLHFSLYKATLVSETADTNA
jgi:hypothetical protein